MAELIDKNELKNRLKWGWMNDTFVLRQIDEMPVADAVSVVRCPECVHYQPSRFEGFWYCDIWDKNMNGQVYPPDKYFCADGERASNAKWMAKMDGGNDGQA